MKVLLIKDVYKLGRAGEIKKVAAGYGRNYLIPRGFALPATPGAMQQAERISVKATERRAVLNEELSDVAEVLSGRKLMFAVKAGETGRLYGSVSDDDILTTIKDNFGIELENRQVETEPIRQLGTYTIPIHLTMDLVPELTVIVHREGEVPEEKVEAEEATEAEATEPDAPADETVEVKQTTEAEASVEATPVESEPSESMEEPENADESDEAAEEDEEDTEA